MKIDLFAPDSEEIKAFEIPFFETLIPAGFPSPAEDYIRNRLDLNSLLIKNPSSTFFARVTGESMIGADIEDSDILIIDRSLKAKDGNIVVAVINGEFTVKRLVVKNRKGHLVPANMTFPDIELTEFLDFQIWGVVTRIIKKAV